MLIFSFLKTNNSKTEERHIVNVPPCGCNGNAKESLYHSLEVLMVCNTLVADLQLKSDRFPINCQNEFSTRALCIHVHRVAERQLSNDCVCVFFLVDCSPTVSCCAFIFSHIVFAFGFDLVSLNGHTDS